MCCGLNFLPPLTIKIQVVIRSYSISLQCMIEVKMHTVRLIAASLFLATRSLAMLASSSLSRLLTTSLSGPTQV